MKKQIIGLSLILALISPLLASAQENTAVFKIGNGNYSVNGTLLEDAEPYIHDGHTYLPLRYVAYAVGVGDNSIYWDQEHQTAFLSKNKTLISIKLGENSIFVGDKEIPVDAAAEIYKDRVMLPLRVVAEALGAQIEWKQVEQQVLVKY